MHTDVIIHDELIVHELFADDLYLLADKDTNSQRQLDGLSRFSKPNQMLANTVKTKVMLYGKNCQKNIKLYLDGEQIEQVEKYKSLGMIFNSVQKVNENMFRYNNEYLNNKARGAIFGIQKKIRHTGTLPINHSFYLYETIVEPIMIYGSDVWGAYAQCTKDINSVFLWFVRCHLNIKATTCNIITIGEAGMIPPKIKCHENVIINFVRLNSMLEDSIVKKVFNELIYLHHMGFRSWISRVLELGKTYGIDIMTLKYSMNTKKYIKTTLRNYFINAWRSDLKDTERYPLLRTYNLFKYEFGSEIYLNLVSNPKYRAALSKFRCSSHTLEIERGRYTIPVTPVDKRLCQVCHEIEDEIHFLLQCPLYSTERQKLIKNVCQIIPNFENTSLLDQFITLLRCKNGRVLSLLGKFIFTSFEIRSRFFYPN